MHVPGGKIAAAPAARSASKSCGGITPPTTIMMSGRPCAASSSRSCGHQREVPGGERVDADDVHVGLDRLPRDLGRGLEQRADVDVEAEVGERGGEHLLPAVVPVLAHLRHQDARPAALRLGELVGRRARLLDRRPRRSRPPRGTRRRSSGSSRRADRRPSPARRRSRRPSPSRAPRRSRARAGCSSPSSARGCGQRVERARDGGVVALGAQPLELLAPARRARRRCRP